MGEDAKKARRPIEPMFIAADNVPIWVSRRRLRRKNAEDAFLERSRDSKPRRMPSVGRPINQGEEQENLWPRIPFAQQAHAEFAALIVEEQKIAGRTNESDRTPHSGDRLQEVMSVRKGLEEDGAHS